MTTRPRLMVLGHARHGKDTFCEKLETKYGYKFVSSSMFMAEKVIFPWFKEHEGQHQFPHTDGSRSGGAVWPTYETVTDCFLDRANWRAKWFELINQTNTPDRATLTRMIFESGNDVYAGLRNQRELHQARLCKAVDLVIWIDRSQHVPPEPASSCTVTPQMADLIIDNNHDLSWLDKQVDILYNNWLSPMEKPFEIPAGYVVDPVDEEKLRNAKPGEIIRILPHA